MVECGVCSYRPSQAKLICSPGMRTVQPTSMRMTGMAWSKCVGWLSMLGMKNMPLRDMVSSVPNSQSFITAPPAGQGWDNICAVRYEGQRSGWNSLYMIFFGINIPFGINAIFLYICCFFIRYVAVVWWTLELHYKIIFTVCFCFISLACLSQACAQSHATLFLDPSIKW